MLIWQREEGRSGASVEKIRVQAGGNAKMFMSVLLQAV